MTEHYVRTEMAPERPPPVSTTGVAGWMRENLFSSISNTILTIFGLYLVYLVVPGVVDWAFVKAVWSGTSGDDCRAEKVGREVGACWAFVDAKFSQFIYGRYPADERWRVDLAYSAGAAVLVPLLIPSVPWKAFNAIVLLAVYPLMTFILLTGGNFDFTRGEWIMLAVFLGALLGVVAAVSSVGIIDFRTGLGIWVIFSIGLVTFSVAIAIDFGLPFVETPLWGGLLVTLVVAITGIVASLPLGVLLALGRRSGMPVVRLFCIGFIEFWRGVPLITVLFMASVVLPLFLPEDANFDKLLRALIGVALFSSAYMAEVIRGGLQAIPKGQYEAAMALGLSYWRMMGFIVLPQALKHVIPGIVNSFIALFKDTTLVLIIGLFDLLGIIQLHFTDAKWITPSTSHTGYAFAGFVFWVFCFAMSRYSIFMEKRLHTGH